MVISQKAHCDTSRVLPKKLGSDQRVNDSSDGSTTVAGGVPNFFGHAGLGTVDAGFIQRGLVP